jgi:hypothetical protein
MKKKHIQQLTLKKITVANLTHRENRALKGGITASCNRTCEPACYSPLCAPTFQANCDTVATIQQDHPDTV